MSLLIRIQICRQVKTRPPLIRRQREDCPSWPIRAVEVSLSWPSQCTVTSHKGFFGPLWQRDLAAGEDGEEGQEGDDKDDGDEEEEEEE